MKLTLYIIGLIVFGLLCDRSSPSYFYSHVCLVVAVLFGLLVLRTLIYNGRRSGISASTGGGIFEGSDCGGDGGGC